MKTGANRETIKEIDKMIFDLKQLSATTKDSNTYTLYIYELWELRSLLSRADFKVQKVSFATLTEAIESSSSFLTYYDGFFASIIKIINKESKTTYLLGLVPISTLK